jgi:hypothetical protein
MKKILLNPEQTTARVFADVCHDAQPEAQELVFWFGASDLDWLQSGETVVVTYRRYPKPQPVPAGIDVTAVPEYA